MAAGDLTINGVDIGVVAAGADATAQGTAVANAINLKTAETGVTATSNAGVITLETANGVAVVIGGASANEAQTETHGPDLRHRDHDGRRRHGADRFRQPHRRHRQRRGQRHPGNGRSPEVGQQRPRRSGRRAEPVRLDRRQSANDSREPDGLAQPDSGPGNWANATLGRALRLILQNIGGALPGEMDRATQGQPAKYTFCCAENEEANPWEPLHVERGSRPTRVP